MWGYDERVHLRRIQFRYLLQLLRVVWKQHGLLRDWVPIDLWHVQYHQDLAGWDVWWNERVYVPRLEFWQLLLAIWELWRGGGFLWDGMSESVWDLWVIFLEDVWKEVCLNVGL
jgi:hypothetical protein